MNEAFKLDEVADLNLPSDLPTTSGQRTMSMPLPMISKHAGSKCNEERRTWNV